MSHKIIWTPRAEKNFDNILSYLEKRWNNQVILAFFDKVDLLLKLISDNPDLFPEVNKDKKIHKCVVIKQITIYYKVKENQVDLITFWDNRQDPEKLNL